MTALVLAAGMLAIVLWLPPVATVVVLTAGVLAGAWAVSYTHLVAKIGENIGLRRYAVVQAPGRLGAYVHGTRIGALVALEGADAALAHDLAMHVAASNPKYLSPAHVAPEVIAKEREFLTRCV